MTIYVGRPRFLVVGSGFWKMKMDIVYLNNLNLNSP